METLDSPYGDSSQETSDDEASVFGAPACGPVEKQMEQVELCLASSLAGFVEVGFPCTLTGDIALDLPLASRGS